MEVKQLSLLDGFGKLGCGEIELRSTVKTDDMTDEVKKLFDYEFTGETVTKLSIPVFPNDFSIGLITGSSGSGKSTLLRKCFGEEDLIEWDNTKAIISNFSDAKTGMELLMATGLGSIPSWCKPYNVLSTGERFRADLARRMHNDSVVDEFTSTVNREAAKSCSYSIQKYIRSKGLKRIVFASCHDDIAEWLCPDWIYVTDTMQFYTGVYLQRPEIELVFNECTTSIWQMFKPHHYLSGSLNRSSKCFVANWNGYPVAFVASLAFPSGSFKDKKAYRESRLVVLPDFQGIGIGNAVSETVAQYFIDRGYRYFSKTANPRCGVHRDNSQLWKPTSHNHSKRNDYLKDGVVRNKNQYTMSEDMQKIHSQRVCYSHEYVGIYGGENDSSRSNQTDG